MPFFKRVEVWVLLVLTIGIVAAVLRMEQSDKVADGDGGDANKTDPAERPKQSGSDTGEEPAARHQITALQIERDGDHAVVEIRLRFLGGTADPATGKARLLRTDGSEVAEFFVPSAATLATTDGERELLFWADRGTLAGELFLEIDGERLKVKDADGFELDEVVDGGRKVIVGQAPRLPPLSWFVHCGKRGACPTIVFRPS